VGETFVLDTSALFAFYQDEDGADRVENILRSCRRKTNRGIISFITIAELYYVTMKEEGESAAKEIVGYTKALPLEIVESDERITLTAGSIKAYSRLSLGDSFIAATALMAKGTLVHKDPEMEQVQAIVSVESLPYKKRKSSS
jgi:predicted nucleic acid-binding protein